MRLIIALFALLVFAPFPALAQTGSPMTAAQLNGEIANTLASAKEIQAVELRQVLLDMVASTLSPAEFTPSSTGNLAFSFDGLAPPYVGFWTDIDNNNFINVMRLRERMFIGNCVGLGSARFGINNTYLPDSTAGANWIPRDSQFCVMDDNGSIAVSGITKSSLSEDISQAPPAISGAFFAINDSVNTTHAAWATYLEVQHQPSGAGLTAGSYGIEIDMKNASTYDPVPNPYAEAAELGGAYGQRILAGGDNSYGPQAANNSAAAIVVTRNAKSWNTGLIFSRYAFGLAGDGSHQNAIEMATNHQISWWNGPATGHGTEKMMNWIRSDASTRGAEMGLVFADRLIKFVAGTDETYSSFFVQHSAGGINAIIVFDGATGVNPLVRPSIQGDTDVALDLRGVGARGVLVGPGGVDFTESTRAFTVYNADRTKPTLNVDTTPTVPVVSTGSAAFEVGTAVDASTNASIPMTLSQRELGIRVNNPPAGTAPGATGIKLAVVCGTNAGSAKIIAYGGTSTTPATVLDNIGAGVTGC